MHSFLSYTQMQFSVSNINNFETVIMATATIINFELTNLESNFFAIIIIIIIIIIININLKKQQKRANLIKIYNKLIKKVDSEKTKRIPYGQN